MSDKDDKVFYAATHVLASLVNDRETTRNYSRERAVDISIEYGELLVKKLQEVDFDSINPVDTVKGKWEEKRRLVVQRDSSGKRVKEGLLNDDMTVEWIKEYK